MDCSDLERLLPAYADGEFASGESVEVEEHLASCPSCSDEVSALLAFRSFLQQKAGEQKVAAPSQLRERIRTDMARERAREQVRRFSLYSAVAAGLVAVASFGYVIAPADEESPELVLFDAVDKHARALPLEVRPTADKPDDVESWFRGKVDFRVRAPTFRSPQAARLVGARLANVRDRQAAYLVYGGEDPARRTTLLVFPGEIEMPDGRRTRVGERDVVMANERGYNVALWQQRGIVYSLVSDLDESDMLQLVSQVEER
ncbi:anti-sigma factor family protein [Vulgatibacter sp.]|uniref:anti-sigma factor family protein n=1 Tax=Vulgatibacter sp. TaxID=1971226 RepID=UPI0035623600